MAFFNKKKGNESAGYNNNNGPIRMDMSKRKKNQSSEFGMNNNSAFGGGWNVESLTPSGSNGTNDGQPQDAVDRLIARERAAENRAKSTYIRNTQQKREIELEEQRRLAQRRASETPPGEGFVKKR